MFSFLRKKNKATENVESEELVQQQDSPQQSVDDTAPSSQTEPEVQKTGLFGRLKQRLNRTSSKLTDGFASLVLGKKVIDDDLLEELETQLLTSDLGIDATQAIISDLTQRVARKQLGDANALFSALRDDMVDILKPSSQPLVIPEKEGPYVILMVGINGVGKTTTIGKLAKQFQNQGKSVMLAAGDTFRAAAVEQLQVWGQRNDIPVIAQHTGADSASVLFDAL
ncbi:signal recognition particle receptor subunit alpha, partial [Agarivorans sp.]|uniref:signal recognition particle receptor subunit alpha n=1 Tax=Agarivorans sp. TaxID=1872412 RepID=UPI003D06FDDD